MPFTTLAQESARDGVESFRVPHFEVDISGNAVSDPALRDVTRITYRDNVRELDGFELVVNNWDPDARAFKFIGSETAEVLKRGGADGDRFKLFEPCDKRFVLKMGYAGDLRVMLTGNVTAMEPSFSSSGPPTLAVRGLNVLHKLRTRPHTYAWCDRRDSDIAEDIARLRDGGRPRFPIPVVTDATAKAAEVPVRYVSQHDQYDIDFLLARARTRGYVVFVQEADPAVRGSTARLYFGPPRGGVPGLRDVTFELRWGATLVEFRPTLTTANQVRSVTVRGWDRRARRPITGEARVDDPALPGNRDLHRLLQGCDPREQIVVDEPVFDRRQARARALAILDERQRQWVKARGTTVGLPDLRAGCHVHIVGVGSRLGGLYFVTETTHTISTEGYTTEFAAERLHGERS